ncbi:MAG: hypothetical protein AAF703_11985 [Cyanobacteria bacterium P01_D01_bin.105]
MPPSKGESLSFERLQEVFQAKTKEHIFVFIVAGDIGGVGKTTMSKVIVDMLRRCPRKVIVIDADDRNRNVLQVYKGVCPTYEAAFSSLEWRQNQFDPILSEPLTHSANGVVNTKAGIGEAIAEHLIEHRQIEVSQEEGLTTIMVIVSDGMPGSLDVAQKLFQEVGDEIPLIFVRNERDFDFTQWKQILKSNEFQKSLRKYNIPVISLPRLDIRTETLVKDLQVPYLDAAYKWRELELPHFNPSVAMRVRRFINAGMYEAMRGILHHVT